MPNGCESMRNARHAGVASLKRVIISSLENGVPPSKMLLRRSTADLQWIFSDRGFKGDPGLTWRRSLPELRYVNGYATVKEEHWRECNNRGAL